MSPPPTITTALDDLPSLSDEDVEILYTIVTTASASSDPPFRALFSAYDSVLAERGIDPDHDQVYFRFLLRMGEGRQHDTKRAANSEGLLLKRFNILLERLGIQVEVAHEDGEEVEETGVDSREGSVANEDNIVETIEIEPLKKRRVSFDTGADSVREPLKLPPRAALSTGDHQERVTRPQNLREHEASSHAQATGEQPRLLQRPPARGALASMVSKPRRQRGSVSSHGSVDIARTVEDHSLKVSQGSSPITGEDSNGETGDFNTDSMSLTNIEDKTQPQANPVALPFRPSDTQMSVDASVYQNQRLTFILRRIIRQWASKVKQIRQRREQMEAAASSIDRLTLLRQGFDAWCASLGSRRQTEETRQFFMHLEQRAEKARNLFLLSKSFTHWAQSASDEVQRTTLARRHILRTRYFNAWKDITVVNDMKARRLPLQKFLTHWRMKTAHSLNARRLAEAVHEENLRKRAFVTWSRRWDDVFAAKVHSRSLTKTAFSHWRLVLDTQHFRNFLARKHHQTALKTKVVKCWRANAAHLRNQNQIAEQFHDRSVAHQTLRLLGKQSFGLPAAHRFREKAQSRELSRILEAWHHQSRLQILGRKVNDRRVVREAFTTWNDNLRVRLLEQSVNVRLATEALYKWYLAGRLALWERQRQQSIKQRALHLWASKATERNFRLEEAELMSLQSQKQRSLTATLQWWSYRCNELIQRERQVEAQHNQSLLRNAFTFWRTKRHESAENALAMSRRADLGREFWLYHSSITKWHSAMLARRRQRRRDAFTQISQHRDANLLRQALSIWREKTAFIRGAYRAAEECAENRTMRHATELFNGWKDRALQLLDMQGQAHSIYSVRICKHSLGKWHDKTTVLLQMQASAHALDTVHVEQIASSAMRSWSWKSFQIKRMTETARALRDRNFDKKRRGMLRCCVDAILAQRKTTGLQREPEIQSQTPLPAYLRTPSRKSTARFNARFPGGGATSSLVPYSATPVTAAASTTLVQGSTTPFTPRSSLRVLRVTPFERKLRGAGVLPSGSASGSGSGMGVVRRVGVDPPSGRGTRFLSLRAEDIQEHSEDEVENSKQSVQQEEGFEDIRE